MPLLVSRERLDEINVSIQESLKRLRFAEIWESDEPIDLSGDSSLIWDSDELDLSIN